MNKQEAIEKIKALKPDEQCLHEYQPEEWEAFQDGFDDCKCYVELIIKQFDEPEKPKVPQFVADWYEERKDYFDFNIYGFYKYFYSQGKHEEVKKWIDNAENKAIETLVKMKLYGYEVEKGKLYTVEIPNPNSAGGKLVLSKQQSTGRLILEMLNSDINKPKYLHLTEDEIKKEFGWAWQFAKEVEE